MSLLALYRGVATVAYPAIWLWLKRRVAKGKEDALRLRERFGYVSIARPKGTVVWVHAASVGESMSVLPLLNRLHDASDAMHVVMTTGTVSSANMISRRLPSRAYHQYVPVDVPVAARRFLKKLRPDLAIWVESEFWPNLMHETHKAGVPMVLVNARMSQRTQQRWQRLRADFGRMMNWFAAIYAGSPVDAKRLQALGVGRVKQVGNLKYDVDALPADPAVTSEVLTNIGDRRIWLASSTHPGEEALIVAVHQKVREVFPDLLTIIVPRHTARGDAVADLLQREKLIVARRSKKQVILPETDIYLADTMGELGIFYRLAGVVFVGGSLVPNGGHNPIEPAQLDCAIMCGPYMDNFMTIADDMVQADALIRVADVPTLEQHLTDLLRDHERQEEMARQAHEFVDGKRGAVDVIFSDMCALLPAPIREKIASESAQEMPEEEAKSR